MTGDVDSVDNPIWVVLIFPSTDTVMCRSLPNPRDLANNLFVIETDNAFVTVKSSHLFGLPYFASEGS